MRQALAASCTPPPTTAAATAPMSAAPAQAAAPAVMSPSRSKRAAEEKDDVPMCMSGPANIMTDVFLLADADGEKRVRFNDVPETAPAEQTPLNARDFVMNHPIPSPHQSASMVVVSSASSPYIEELIVCVTGI